MYIQIITESSYKNSEGKISEKLKLQVRMNFLTS